MKKKNQKNQSISIEQQRLETYKIWEEMIARCNDPEHPEFKNEGARGIKVRDKWMGAKGFENFIQDMGLCSEGGSLEKS